MPINFNFKELDTNKIISVAIFIMLLSWIVSTNLYKKEINAKNAQLQQLQQSKQKYDYLKSRWDEKSLKASLEALQKQINSFGTNVKATTRKNYTKISFDIETKKTNLVISKILNTNLVYKSFSIVKNDDFSANITLEVIL
jgi:Tfp pilus assembly protein PilO